MTKDNRVLTLSYGTHACTLEGFENALHAVEPILEYFRDMTQDAQSGTVARLQPDAVVLAQIAARATSLAVEPSQQAGRIVLSVIEDPLVPPPAAAAEPTMVKLMGDALTAAIVQKKPDPQIAAKAAALDEETWDPDPAVQDAPQSAEAFFANSTPIAYIDENDMAAPPVATHSDGRAQSVTTASPPPADDDSVAAKLRRIHDVLSREDSASAGAQSEQTSRDQFHSKDHMAPVQNTTLTEAAEEIAAALVEDDQIAVLAEDVFDAEKETLRETLNSLTSDTEPPLTEPEDDDETENVFARTGPQRDAAGNNNVGTLRLRRDWAEGTALPSNTSDAGADKAAFDTSTADDDTPVTSDQPQPVKTSLRRRDREAEGDPAAQEPAVHYCSPGFDQSAGEDLSRLMAKAEHQMEDPDGATRRNAFSHLRAAVAARFADKSMRDGTTETEATKAYRSDLAEVVRPRRPVASVKRTTRRPNAQATPLKLAPEQRVDIDVVMAKKPAASQHAATSARASPDASAMPGFANFAEEMGATKLPDLLEAAAAYLSLVEGSKQFSSTQVITHARLAKRTPFSREEGLRAFGQLLRDGKINKLKEGRFTVSDTNSFVPG
ncbi:MAG: hypothetical protein R8G34_08545 [Paracoccaceae bacterium]|nr:hypothetical protein [Paracoccaceae bacterium]